jgi:fibronectin-binding autotransporter adhesin
MKRLCGSLFAATDSFASWKNTVCAMGLAVACSVVSLSARAADDSWKGTTNALWSVGTNWSLGASPGSGDVVRFDNQSTSNLTLNNDLFGVSVQGIANTQGSGVGPSGNVAITGNPITVGSVGIRNGSGSPPDQFGYGAAQVNMTVDVDLTLSANQSWKGGGPGTGTPGQQSVIIGASPNSHTVTLNGFKPTIQAISNAFDQIIVNSKLVDGSGASSLSISKAVVQTNHNANMRVRIAGDNTYSGGTDILGARQDIQIASSSVKSGNAIVSGPFGTNAITVTPDVGFAGANNQNPYFQAYGADREVDNDITVNGSMLFASSLDDTSSGDTAHRTLTLGGTITVPGNGSFLQFPLKQIAAGSARLDGAGDTVFTGNMLLTGTTTALTIGQGGDGPVAGTTVAATVIGKQVFNGNILQTNGSGTSTVTIANGTAAVPTVVQLNGQNTFVATTLAAVGGSTAGDYNFDGKVDAGDYVIWRKDPAGNGGDPAGFTAWRANFGRVYSANLGIGSSSVLDGSNNIISGPLGLGTLTVSGATTNGSTIEAIGGARSVANTVVIGPTVQAQMNVMGSNDLTFTGNIGGVGKLTKNGSAKLILNGTGNSYTGDTVVNSGTLLVNGAVTGTGSTTINYHGTLGGGTTATPGTLSGNVTSFGTISPGASIGTLTLNGSLSLNDGSSFRFELGSSGSDLLNVGTDLTLPSSGFSTVNLVNAGGMTAGLYTLIDYNGTALTDITALHLGTQPGGFTYQLINNQGNTSIDLQVNSAGGGSGSGLGTNVPEPMTLGLVLVGFAALCVGRNSGRRR